MTQMKTATNSSELDDLRSVLREFLAKNLLEANARTAIDGSFGYDRPTWQRLAKELGVVSLAIGEEQRSPGENYAELLVVMEELGRALYDGPYLASAVAAATALTLVDDPTVANDLIAIGNGDTIATVAFDDDGDDWNPEALQTSATQLANGSWIVSGRKTNVLSGNEADKIVVAARTGVNPRLFLVETRAPGVKRDAARTMDITRDHARFDLMGAPAQIIGREGAVDSIISRTTEVCALALAAEQVGGARHCVEMAVNYAKERKQFGQPVGTFQAVKHRLASMYVKAEAASAAVDYAANALASGAAFREAISIAQVYCTNAFQYTAAENIQVHGGVGFTWEHPAHLYYKRALTSRNLFGSPKKHLDRIAVEVGL